MKTIRILTTIIVAAFCIASCSDYLDIDIQEKQSTDISYNKVSNIDQALNGVYGCLRPLSKYYWQMSEARSDNSYVNTPGNVRAASQIAHFENSILKENSIILNCWNDYFKLTASANKLLSEIDNVDFSEVSSKLNGIGKTPDELRTHYKAETRFLRALAYFDLVRFFGRVPATTKYLTTEEAFQLKQSEPTDVLENIIIPDLQYAVENLSYAPFDYQGASRLERAAKPAAQALLARVYLTMEGYPYYDTSHHDEAVSLLKDIIDYSAANSGKWWATTINDWEQMWVHENDNKYFIFEIQYALAASMGNPMTPVSVSWSLVNSEWCTKNYVNADVITYVANDLRSHFTDPDVDEADIEYYDKRGPATLSTISVSDDGTYVDGSSSNCFNVKFFENIKKREAMGLQSIDGQMLNYTWWPQNFPLIRFEDVLLMYAELVGPTTDGYAAINRIRQRAGLLPLSGLSADDFQTAVRRERQYELAGEGVRWHDLVRWNIYVETMKRILTIDSNRPDYAAFVTKETYLYPIPFSQIQVREGLYTQNPGY